MTTIIGSPSDDIMVPTTDGGIYRGLNGNDTYILHGSLISANAKFTIIDTEGANKIQLADGLSIKSSLFTANAVKLILSNGAEVKILGADKFAFDLGASMPNQTYAQLATTLGVLVLPTDSTLRPGTPDYVVPGTAVVTPTPPVFAFAAVNGNSLVMTYTEATTLDAVNKAPASAFAVLVNGVTDSISAVTVDANAKTVTLTLSTPVTQNQVVTVSYTDPTAGNDINAIQNAAGNDATTLSAQAVINNTAGGSGGAAYPLTTDIDHLVGTAGNDTFSATYNGGVATDTFGFGGSDFLDGSGGTDTLNIDHPIDVAITPPDALWSNITGIEKVVINTTGNGAQTITTGAGFQSAFVAGGVDLMTTTSGSGAINLSMSTFTGAATVSTTSLAGAQTIVTGSGVATVTATSGAGALTIYGSGLEAVTANTTGSGAQTIGDGSGGGAHLVTVTAASNSGAQIITSTSTSAVTVHATATAAPQTITTGTGNDTVTATGAAGQSNTLTSNAGNDTIVAGPGTDSITGGTGADRMTGGGGADTFVFGSDGSVLGTSMDVITDFNAAGADILVFGASTALLSTDATALVAGLNVQQSAGGLITFHADDNTLALKIVAVQADVQLDAAGSIAMFIDSGNTYIYYAGTAAGNADDQMIELTGIASLITITGGGSTVIA